MLGLHSRIWRRIVGAAVLVSLVGTLDMAVGIHRQKDRQGRIVCIRADEDGCCRLRLKVSPKHSGRIVSWWTEKGPGIINPEGENVDEKGEAFALLKPLPGKLGIPDPMTLRARVGSSQPGEVTFILTYYYRSFPVPEEEQEPE